MEPVYKADEFFNGRESVFECLMALDWLSVTEARKEYFMSMDGGIPYTYGSGINARTYVSEKFIPEIERIRVSLSTMYATGWDYNVCFLNRYDNEKNQLGWHADDSPEMNPEHDIAVVSFGAEREIWWKDKEFRGVIPMENRRLLENGSLFIMPAGFQKDNFHKIPKWDRPCGTRISLTFRNYKQPIDTRSLLTTIEMTNFNNIGDNSKLIQY